MKILVVDDDQNIRRLVSFNLSLENHEIFVASNGKEGIQVALAKDPDLILLDIMMPVMDGYKTCEWLKKNPRTKDIPIFMLSVKGQMTDLDNAFNAGADDYITKPFDVEKLNKTINYKLESFQERKKKVK
ncbi:MAG: response regulator [Candidatus Cloacimonetes bacterium]|jgi:DNA-binding response OmpR family regulator|nr:response regulator [Candidatus Cloacimonadota bacterium]